MGTSIRRDIKKCIQGIEETRVEMLGNSSFPPHMCNVFRWGTVINYNGLFRAVPGNPLEAFAVRK